MVHRPHDVPLRFATACCFVLQVLEAQDNPEPSQDVAVDVIGFHPETSAQVRVQSASLHPWATLEGDLHQIAFAHCSSAGYLGQPGMQSGRTSH